MTVSNQSTAAATASEIFGEPVVNCSRFTTGLRHWVYDIVLASGRTIVMRFSHPDHRDELEGGVYWSALLRNQDAG